MGVVFKADPESLQAIATAFERFMLSTRSATDSFLHSANRCATGLDAASLNELQLLTDSVKSLSSSLNRFCAENSGAALKKKAVLAEIAQLSAY